MDLNPLVSVVRNFYKKTSEEEGVFLCKGEPLLAVGGFL